jgi:hypothetical protein
VSKPPVWEYAYADLTGGKEAMERLNFMGQQGWELVCITGFLIWREGWFKRCTGLVGRQAND